MHFARSATTAYFPPPPSAACHPERQRGTCFFARTAATVQVHHHRPQRVIPSASEGPAFRPHRRDCFTTTTARSVSSRAPARDLLFARTAATASPPPPPAACHPERQRGTCFSPAPPRPLKSTTAARSVSSRAPARDLLFARTATTADVIRDVNPLQPQNSSQAADSTANIICVLVSGFPFQIAKMYVEAGRVAHSSPASGLEWGRSTS